MQSSWRRKPLASKPDSRSDRYSTRGDVAPAATTYTITSPGSYVLGGNYFTSAAPSIVINANNVTLDLRGFYVKSGVNSACAPNTIQTYGVTCTPAFGAAVISATGQNITIKNGSVVGGSGQGVTISSGTPGNVLLQDLKVIGNRGDGIVIAGTNSVIQNVISSTNGGAGITTGGFDLYDNVSVSWNNRDGINSYDGNFQGVASSNNGMRGLNGTGTASSVSAGYNNDSGISIVGTVSGLFSSLNTWNYVEGILTDSFIYGPIDVECYSQTYFLTAPTGAPVPMTSNVCP